jgi:serine/threonine protein kinase
MKSENDNPDAFEIAKTLLREESQKVGPAEPSAAQIPARLTTPGASSNSILDTGTPLQGRYAIEREIGRGGIGAVFLARDTKLHSRLVVVKVLLDDMAQDAWVYKKFQQEVEALTRIEHPNIVGILDSGELPNGKPFIVMQYVDGATLRSQMKPEGMSLERVAMLTEQIGRALGVAHSKGILHRDLKPENIMIQLLADGEEQVKIIDFGIARVHDSQVAPTTVITSRAGTIAYMSPEQLAVDPLDITSDVYSLGIISYEMITGRRPFNPDSIIQLYEMQRDGVRVKPKDLRPALPEAAQEVLLKSLAFDPADRYKSAREFCDDLADALKGNFDVSHQSHARARATREQRAAPPTRLSPNQPAVAAADAPTVNVPYKPRSRARPKVFIPIAVLVLLLAVAGVFLYKRFTNGSKAVASPPRLTTAEFNDEFLNLARWTAPPSGWNINVREGRLEIENQPQVGFPNGINYDNFEMNFHLKLLNDAGAAWALRVNDSNNYYLFYLSGPGGNYPNRFITYVVRDGKFSLPNFALSTPFTVELKSGGQYEVNIKAEGNQITQKITPAETGDEVNLGLFHDPDNTFTFGGIGFRTVGIEKFSIDDLYVRPLGTKLPQ